MNAERRVVQTQLKGICTAFEYVAGLAFKAYIGSGLNTEVERGEGSSERGGETPRVGRETREAGVGTSEVEVEPRLENSEGTGEVQGADQGVTEGVDEPGLVDKGKQKEVLDEETVQEG